MCKVTFWVVQGDTETLHLTSVQMEGEGNTRQALNKYLLNESKKENQADINI